MRTVTLAVTAAVAVGALPVSWATSRTETRSHTHGVWGRDHGGGTPARGRCGPEGSRRCLAFTFDDGPDFSTTPALLAMLREHRIQATFFVVGHRLDGDDPYHTRNREVLRTLWRQGHLVGNHSYHHVVLDNLRTPALDEEIDHTESLIRGALGQRSWLLRAPYGAFSRPRTVDGVYARGYTQVGWTLDTMDWSVNRTEDVVRNFRVVLNAHPHGGVVLMHDTHAWSVRAFPLILREIERRNEAARAHGEAPYEIVGLQSFYDATGSQTAPAVP